MKEIKKEEHDRIIDLKKEYRLVKSPFDDVKKEDIHTILRGIDTKYIPFSQFVLGGVLVYGLNNEEMSKFEPKYAELRAYSQVYFSLSGCEDDELNNFITNELISKVNQATPYTRFLNWFEIWYSIVSSDLSIEFKKSEENGDSVLILDIFKINDEKTNPQFTLREYFEEFTDAASDFNLMIIWNNPSFDYFSKESI